METIQQQITIAFLRKLEESGKVDTDKIKALKSELQSGKKVRAEDLAKIFSLPAGGDLK